MRITIISKKRKKPKREMLVPAKRSSFNIAIYPTQQISHRERRTVNILRIWA